MFKYFSASTALTSSSAGTDEEEKRELMVIILIHVNSFTHVLLFIQKIIKI